MRRYAAPAWLSNGFERTREKQLPAVGGRTSLLPSNHQEALNLIRTRMRKLGSGIGAFVLVAGFAGGVLGTSLVTASAAGASPTIATVPAGAYKCTVSDVTHPAFHVTSGTLHFKITGEYTPLTLTVNHPGDLVKFTCHGLTPTEGIAMIQASGLASLDTPSKQQTFATLTNGNTGAAATTTGTLSTSISTTYANKDHNVTCPTNALAANLGVPTCIVTAADIKSELPLIVVDLKYSSDAAPTATAIKLTSKTVLTVKPNTTTTPVTLTTSHGYWWGASEFGTKGDNPTSPIPNPTIRVTGVLITAAGTGAGSAKVSPAAYAWSKVGPTYGTPTYPVATFSGVVLPKGLTPGPHYLTVTEGTLEATQITATTQFFVPGGSASTKTVPAGKVGPGTGFTLTSKGWANDSTTSWTVKWVPPVGCNGTAEITATSFTPTPAYPAGPTGAESFHVSSSDIPKALFTTTNCVPAAWKIHVIQQVTDPTPAVTGTFGPITLVNLTSSCTIVTTGSCLVQQAISQKVTGTKLTVTEYQATTLHGLGGTNPSAILVNLSKVTLGPGVFQAGQGVLNTVVVNDSRGTLGGWSTTGEMETIFLGTNIGRDHTIPADYLTWNPSVSLTYPGNLKAGVAGHPGGLPSPTPYGPDACPKGAASGGTNSNVKCPSNVNDSAGSANPAGKTNLTTTANHPHETTWPSATAEGPSGLLTEVKAGPIANLDSVTGSGYETQGVNGPQVLCKTKAHGEGGGSFNCTASLSLAVPPYVAAGTYQAKMDIITTAT